MEFKKIFILSAFLVFIILTMNTINAVEDNSTNETLETIDTVEYEENNGTVLQSTVNDDNSSLISSTQEDTLKSDIVSYNKHDEYEYGTVKTTFNIDRNLKVKYKSNSIFGIYLCTSKGYEISENYKIILKVWTGKKVKQYNVRLHDGYYGFNTKKLKTGTHKVEVIFKGNHYEYFGCKAKTKIIVKKNYSPSKKKASKWKYVNIKIRSPKGYFAHRKLKSGDMLETVYSLGGQYSKGVYAQILDYDYPIHAKIKKVKFYFKKGGSIKTKVTRSVKNSKYSSIAKVSLIKGYKPFKAKVWYKMWG